MMQIKTGKGPINLLAVLAIWSLSLSVDLPGLAVSPMLSELSKIFPTATQLEVQLVTILPNLAIIPFALLSGKLSRSNHKIAVIVAGLIIYLAAAVLYFVFKSMTGIIWISCLLGVGCGLLLPFSTGLIADVFVGKYRMKQMGIISAVGNLAVLVATFVVGWLASIRWDLPFIVYFIPVVTLLLMPFMSKIPHDDLYTAKKTDDTPADKKEAQTAALAVAPVTAIHKAAPMLKIPAVDAAGFSTKGQKVANGFYIGRSFWLCLSYFFLIFVTEITAYYMPFSMAEYGMNSTEVGLATAFYFGGMFVVGLMLTSILKGLRGSTYIVSMLLLIAGFLIYIFWHTTVGYCVGTLLLGLSAGTIQPIIYDKATEMCVTQNRSTLALAIVLAVNYAAIVLVPFVTDIFRDLFGIHKTDAFYNMFPFVFDLVITGAVFILVLIRAKGFVFGIHKQYYS